MNKKRIFTVSAIVSAAILTGLLSWKSLNSKSDTTIHAPHSEMGVALEDFVPGNQVTPTSTQPSVARPSVSSTLKPATAPNVADVLESVFNDLRSGNPSKMKAALDRLDEVLANKEIDRHAAIAAIVSFLKSGRDASTGENFQVGQNGVLASGNTLRVVLLDQLGTLCRDNGSAEALSVAQDVLAKFGSADEWAVCLRNVAWLDANSGPMLAEKFDQMLNHPAWATQPSRGMLESFDVVAYTGATQMIPQLADLLKSSDSNPLWRASTVALEQMASKHPSAVLEWLSKNPGAMNDHPMQRADLLSKADMSDPAQRRIVESYLGRSDLSVEERGKIVAGLVSPGSFLSENLLTSPGQFTQESEAKRLALLHDIGQTWNNAGKFSDLTPFVDGLLKGTEPPSNKK